MVPGPCPGNTLLHLPPFLTMKGRHHLPLFPGVLATPCIQAFARAAPSPWTTCPPSLHQLNSTLPVPLSSDITSLGRQFLKYVANVLLFIPSVTVNPNILLIFYFHHGIQQACSIYYFEVFYKVISLQLK